MEEEGRSWSSAVDDRGRVREESVVVEKGIDREKGRGPSAEAPELLVEVPRAGLAPRDAVAEARREQVVVVVRARGRRREPVEVVHRPWRRRAEAAAGGQVRVVPRRRRAVVRGRQLRLLRERDEPVVQRLQLLVGLRRDEGVERRVSTRARRSRIKGGSRLTAISFSSLREISTANSRASSSLRLHSSTLGCHSFSTSSATLRIGAPRLAS